MHFADRTLGLFQFHRVYSCHNVYGSQTNASMLIVVSLHIAVITMRLQLLQQQPLSLTL